MRRKYMRHKSELPLVREEAAVTVRVPGELRDAVNAGCEAYGMRLNSFAANAFGRELALMKEKELALEYLKALKEKETAVDFRYAAGKAGLENRYFKNGKQKKAKIK